MATKAEILAEAYKRGLLPADKRAAYEEAVTRGIVYDPYAAGRVSAKSKGGKLSAAVRTFNEAVPGFDEADAALQTARNVITGEAKLSDIGKTYGDWRKRQLGEQDQFRQDNPNASNLSTGLGYAIQAVPAFLSGGSTAAPQVAAKSPTLPNALTAMGVRTAKNATVGATVAAGNALAGRGDVQERVQAANNALVPGAALGVVVPAAVRGVTLGGKGVKATVQAGGRVATRTANKVASKMGAEFLDPKVEASARLVEALRADGFTEAKIREALTEWNRVGGASPAFMDLIAKNGGGQRTMALFRGAAMSGGGRNVASQYANQVAADLQDTAVARTRQLTPDQRTIPQIEGDITSRIEQSAQAPQVQPGQAGAMASERLNAQFDQARAGVRQAYDTARAANPEQAQLSRDAFPQMVANIREAVRDFHPESVPRVARELASLDRTSTPTARDLFDLRSRLTALRASNDPVEATAAARAVNALDAEIGAAVEQGRMTGDPQVVDLWRNAIGARREMGRTFEGGDLVQTLTERSRYGGDMTNAIAPEDASNAILGRNGMPVRSNAVRDLTRLRDQLGADSPEWRGIQREAQARILGRDAGSERFGQAWVAFERDNPELARLLSTEADRAGVSSSRQQISGAIGDRNALEVGQGIMTSAGDQYAADFSGVGPRAPIAQTSAARTLQGNIERPPEGATGVLNRIGTATQTGRNLSTTYGEQPAADYRASIQNMVEQVNNARFINPNTGSQTSGRLTDESLVENLPQGKIGLIKWIVDKVRAGATLTDAEREVLVQVATSKATPVDIPNLPPRAPNALDVSTGPSRLSVPASASQDPNQRRLRNQ